MARGKEEEGQAREAGQEGFTSEQDPGGEKPRKAGEEEARERWGDE